jgi:hypothetical protein
LAEPTTAASSSVKSSRAWPAGSQVGGNAGIPLGRGDLGGHQVHIAVCDEFDP